MVRIIKDGEVLGFSSELPLVPLRDVVVFPYMTVSLLIGRKQSIDAIESAYNRDRMIFLSAQKDPILSSPTSKDIHQIGTISKITHMLKLPDGTVKVLVEGIVRAKIEKFLHNRKYFSVKFSIIKGEEEETMHTEALLRNVRSQFEEYVRLNKKIPNEVLLSISHIQSPEKLIDAISSHFSVGLETKQKLLECASIESRLRFLSIALASEIDILKLGKKLEEDVKSQVMKSQKQFYLAEQMRAIKRELGQEENETEEILELRKAIESTKLPEEVEKKANKELERLKKMPPMSPEATVIRNYLDWFISLPWEKRTKDNLSIKHAERILNEDHYGLEKPKERIIEFLSVLKLIKKMKGPIICFVGAPGVGKTSLGKSIARALGRKFVRMSLGGVRDEAEIRGHRRTYIGALPGRIIQNVKKAETKNPVFLLDEVDKIGLDYRGDPAAALIEVLDPEVNYSFNDHYLEVDFDLSEIFFICTANVLHTIPPALKDRMEVIRLPGYLEHEKLQIAKGFLIPKQLKSHGLRERNLKFTDEAIVSIIRNYTKEVGVRNLEREIAAISRKVARLVATKKKKGVTIKKSSLEKYLGAPKFLGKELDEENEIGVATGLSWTELGGELIQLEVEIVKGKGELILTGQLGDIMKESAQAALTYARSRATSFGLPDDFSRKIDIHVHVPEGAIPKDGPSAGITIATAMLSALTKIPTFRNVAMSGEITLRGRVLPIGGLAEKLVAAQRAGVKTVIIPIKNEKDLKEIPTYAKKGLDIKLVKSMDEVLEITLTKKLRTQQVMEYKQERVFAH